jgi:formylmethanofuran dehydrogenase subunit E
MLNLQPHLAEASKRHSHLCPRLVLGVRMALAGARCLDLEILRADKRLLVIVETDGCFLDGIEVTAGVTPGHRTLRIEDYGKVAATFVDVETEVTVRLAPQLDVRARARDYAAGETRPYFAQLAGYQVMPDEALFSVTPVVLTPSVRDLISRAGVRASCVICGEEIINEREIAVAGEAYCRSCWGQSYYHAAAPLVEPVPVAQWPQTEAELAELRSSAGQPRD